MEAHARDLEKIFDRAIQYQIPLFQRPYVWTEAEGWQELWEDIEDLLNKQLTRGKVHPHFMGAVVLEQLGNATGAIETRQIIDGQQRFTTLQIVLAVCRDLAVRLDNERYRERFGDFVANSANRIDHELEAFKLWPTNSDRAAWRLVTTCGSAAELEKLLKATPDLRASNIVKAYFYFTQQLSAWFETVLEGDGGPAPQQPDLSERLEALWTVMRGKLQLVVIDLNDQDEAQVIFETMNSTGQELLPTDLIKNFLFRRAGAEDSKVVEKLYDQHWAPFEDTYWRQMSKGRLPRPVIDIFLNQYLAMVTQDDVKSTHLFNAFKDYVADEEKKENKLIETPTTAAEHMAALARFGRIYRAFGEPDQHPRLATFQRRMEALETTTVYPFLLLAYDALMPDNQAEFDRILVVLESFLFRRLVCGLTTKGYNRIFIDLTKAVAQSGNVSAAFVSAWLARSSADSQRFPNNEEFGSSVLIQPLYKATAQKRVRALLEAVDAALQHSKSEAVPLPAGLTIEHVLPQDWRDHWPIPAEVKADPIQAQEWTNKRETLLHTLGNLTLITHSLNPALSNAAWDVKRPELLKFSKLNLTQYFHEDAQAGKWDEHAILKRSAELAGIMIRVWPDGVRTPQPEAEPEPA